MKAGSELWDLERRKWYDKLALGTSARRSRRLGKIKSRGRIERDLFSSVRILDIDSRTTARPMHVEANAND